MPSSRSGANNDNSETSQKRLFFTGKHLNTLVSAALHVKPYNAPFGQKLKSWDEVARLFNKELPEKDQKEWPLTGKTAEDKIKALYDIHKNGRNPAEDLRAPFDKGQEGYFSSILDKLCEEMQAAEDAKAKKSAKKAKELQEREEAGARVRAAGMQNLVRTQNAMQDRTQTSDFVRDAHDRPGDCMASGPLHSVLSKFMSVQNHCTDLRTQQFLRLMSDILEEERRQSSYLKRIAEGIQLSSAPANAFSPIFVFTPFVAPAFFAAPPFTVAPASIIPLAHNFTSKPAHIYNDGWL
ncbi:hypothetical protein EV122DRAFT_284720 [Schizophyllum commune]